MKVSVNTLGAEVASLALESTASIHDVQDLLTHVKHLPRLRQRLVHKGVLLAPELSLEGAGIHDGDDLTLVVLPSHLLLTASSSGAVKLWAAETGECLRTLNGHCSWLTSAAFSPNGEMVLTSSADGIAKLWSVDSGECIRTLDSHHGAVVSATFSLDGTVVLTAFGDGCACLWCTTSGSCLQTFHDQQSAASPAMFSRDGTRLVAGSADGSAKIWSTASGICQQILTGHTGSVVSAGFSADGSKVLTASYDCTAKLWDASTGECLSTLAGHTGALLSASFSPDGETGLTTSNDGLVKLWDLTSAECRLTLGGNGCLPIAQFSANGELFLTYNVAAESSAKKGSTAAVYRTSDGEHLHDLDHGVGGHVALAVFSSFGSAVLTTDNRGLAKVWEAESGECQCVIPNAGHIARAAFAP